MRSRWEVTASAIPNGGIATLLITGVNRLNGFNGLIHLTIKFDLPTSWTVIGIEGTIPASVVPTSEKPYVIPVFVNPNSKPSASQFFAVGTFRPFFQYGKAERFESRMGITPDTVKVGLANLTYMPLEMSWQSVVGVYDPRFTLRLPDDAFSLKPGDKATVKLTRAGEYTGEVALTAINLPANVTMKPATLKADAKEMDLELTADAKAPAGVGRLVILGKIVKPKGKEKDPDYAVYGVGGEITVLGEAKKEPAKKK